MKSFALKEESGRAVVVSVNDWIAAGNSYNQFLYESRNGRLRIYKRSTKGNTLIYLNSIQNREILQRIIDHFTIEKQVGNIYEYKTDLEAQSFFMGFKLPSGRELTADKIFTYTKRASIFTALQEGLNRQSAACKAVFSRIKMAQWYELALQWHNEQCRVMGLHQYVYTSARSFKVAFDRFQKQGYQSFVNRNHENKNNRKVSAQAEKLLIALWKRQEKPFITDVARTYNDFVLGKTTIFDKSTGEVFNPEDFRINNKPMVLTIPTIRNYLKKAVNYAVAYVDRNGHFEYNNLIRPKVHRAGLDYSLSKISMDDVALSRKSTRGWVYKYIAVDTLSGYYFRPEYIVGKPTMQTVISTFRNMFCELIELGLPMPAELEVEHHLMKDIDWLQEAFTFVRFCNSPSEKRAEHMIKSLKYGSAKTYGHTRGRWYARSEAFRAPRYKENGDIIEPTLEYKQIIFDDLCDIDKHNNQLHPNQERFPNKTRKQVLLENVNPNLAEIVKHQLFKYIGNVTHTTIRNNYFCHVNNAKYSLQNIENIFFLNHSKKLDAYWLPNADGYVKEVYLYQGDKFIGAAINQLETTFKESKAEMTEEDYHKMHAQLGNIKKFDKLIKQEREQIPHIEIIRPEQEPDPELIEHFEELEIQVNDQPENYEEDGIEYIEMEDFAKRAKLDA